MTKYINLTEWLSLFNLEIITFNQFIEISKISNNQKLKDKIIDPEILKLLYIQFILNKKQYLINFYNKSLKVPNDLDLNNIDVLSINNSKNSKYKNIIRNIYYREILQQTKSGIKGLNVYLDVITNLFNNYIIDYKLTTPSGIRYIKNNNFGSIMSAFYFRASILNPAVIFSIYNLELKKYYSGKVKIFSPTLGWSSYLYGLLSNDNIIEYVGTDVIKSVCVNTNILGKSLFPNKFIDIYCKPSEDLLKDQRFMNKYSNYFDIIFFSPPYYKQEIYSSDNQSVNRYVSYDSWLLNYWEQTIILCSKLLRPDGGILCYIISNYEKYSNLVLDMNNITNRYFKLIKKLPLENNKMYNNNSEVIHIYTLNNQ